MPFKSEAQRRHFAAEVKAGKFTKEQFDEWNKDTPAKLPERLGKKGQPRIAGARGGRR